MGNSPTPSDHTLQVQRLFVQHQQVVLYYVLTIEPNLGDAQDIVQETFLTVSRKADTYHSLLALSLGLPGASQPGEAQLNR